MPVGFIECSNNYAQTFFHLFSGFSEITDIYTFHENHENDFI